MKTVNPQTLHTWLSDGSAMLIDVREPAEHASSHIASARLLPLGHIGDMQAPPADKKLVIHCQKGARGETACKQLSEKFPHADIYNLEGGIAAWQTQGLAVQSSGRKTLSLDRQVQLTIGAAVLTGSVLAYTLNPLFVILSGFFGAGLLFAGATGTCGLALAMARMPWNRA